LPLISCPTSRRRVAADSGAVIKARRTVALLLA
jgi:hypothetical protein